MLFETGYGPSGLPHIGTFGEVVRTTMVRHAFQRLSRYPDPAVRLLRRHGRAAQGADNVPNQEMLAQHLGKPLTKMPDPFGTHESFGHHNNARLRAFLDAFGFEYEFQSSTDWYKSGRFDEALLEVLRHYDEIMEVMLPTLREERAATYSPFLPVCAKTGRCCRCRWWSTMSTPAPSSIRTRTAALVETPVTGGHCKLQWKPRLGDALGRARRRLRDVGQGPDPLGRARQQDLPHPGRHAAGGLQLRAVPGREGPEDLQVQGQRPDASRSG